MVRLAILALAAGSPSPAPRVPVPLPPHVVAPRLEPLSEADVRPILATPQHCLFRRGGDLLFAATDLGHYAVIRIKGLMSIDLTGMTPVRQGGRFAPSPMRVMVWLSPDPRDAGKAVGETRRANMMVIGADGGADGFAGTYQCSY